MVMVFLQFEPIWVNLDTNAGQYQVKFRSNFEMLNLGKQRHDFDAECAQKPNGAVCLSVRWLEVRKTALDVFVSQS